VQLTYCHSFGETVLGRCCDHNTFYRSRGIVLDSTQIKVLLDSWGCSDPSKPTVYKKRYRSTFPVSSQSEETLSVPSLDNMIETLLVKKYGSKCFKSQSLSS
jgi:hypothetical protein